MAGKIGIPEGQISSLKPHRPSWEGPEDELPTNPLGDRFRRRDSPLLKCHLLFSDLTWNPENSEIGEVIGWGRRRLRGGSQPAKAGWV